MESNWTKFGVIIAVLAVIGSFFVPEVRRALGLEKPGPVVPASQTPRPSEHPTTEPEPPPTVPSKTTSETHRPKRGTAIGNGAKADGTSVAIGEHAGSSTVSAPNGIAITGGNVTNPTVNNFGTPERHADAVQLAKIKQVADSLPSDSPQWFFIETMNDTETVNYAGEIESVFQQDGRVTSLITRLTERPPIPHGVFVITKGQEDEHFQIAQNIANGLSAAGVPAVQFEGAPDLKSGQVKVIFAPR
jgi:hypothetical protein